MNNLVFLNITVCFAAMIFHYSNRAWLFVQDSILSVVFLIFSFRPAEFEELLRNDTAYILNSSFCELCAIRSVNSLSRT